MQSRRSLEMTINSSTWAVVHVLQASAQLVRDSRQSHLLSSPQRGVKAEESFERVLDHTANAIIKVYAECLEDCGSSFGRYDAAMKAKFRYMQLEALDIKEDVSYCLHTAGAMHRPDALRERVVEVASVAAKAMNEWSRKVLKMKLRQPKDEGTGCMRDDEQAAQGNFDSGTYRMQMPPTPPPDDPHRYSNIEPVHPLRLASSQKVDRLRSTSPPVSIDQLQASPNIGFAPLPPQESHSAAQRGRRRAIQVAVEAAKSQRESSQSKNSSSSSTNSPTEPRLVVRQNQPPRAKYSLMPRTAPTSAPASRTATLGATLKRPEISTPIPISTLVSPAQTSTTPPVLYSPSTISSHNDYPSARRRSSAISSTTSEDHDFCTGGRLFRNGDLKGLLVRTIPRGTVSTTTFIECAAPGCTFQGKQSGKSKKRPTLDPAICHHPKTGMRFRWAFLAKSHFTCTAVDKGSGILPFSQTFGCLFCMEDGSPSGRLNGVDELMTHVLRYHSDHMPMNVRRERNVLSGCVGRSEDDFDINIPMRHSEKLRQEAEESIVEASG